MFQSLDIAIGFVMVMAMMSMIVTSMTQVASALLGWRGVYLKEGLRGLLARTSGLDEKQAEALAQKVLHHHLVSDSTLWASELPKLFKFLQWFLDKWKLAAAIDKNELPAVLQAIESESPAAGKALATEAAKAQAAIGAAATTALAQVDSISQWFDSTMNRVSQRFGTKCRVWTVAFSFILAFGIHLDSFTLLTKLSQDPQDRARLIGLAATVQQSGQAVLQAAATQQNSATPSAQNAAPNAQTNAASTAPNSQVQATITAVQNMQAQINEEKDLLGSVQFDIVPGPSHFINSGFVVKYTNGLFTTRPDWFSGSRHRHFFGMLLTGVLLSLGAPFWFNSLKSLLSLRSTVAEATDPQKASGNSTAGAAAPAPAPKGPLPPPTPA
jgi:hypothetical protein